MNAHEPLPRFRIATVTVILLAGVVATEVLRGALPVGALAVAAAVEQTSGPATKPVLEGVFEGRTPCGDVALDFTKFPQQNCEKIKWQITLYRDASRSPATYLFEGTRSKRQGKWTIERGAAARADAEVYRLHADVPGGSLLLMKVDDNLLLVMDRNRNLVVGDASWSYTLSRTAKIPTADR